MNKLERRVLAITKQCINPKNNDRIVKAGKFLGKVEGFVGDDRWEIKSSAPLIGAIYGRAHWHCRAIKLRVIGDNPGDESFVTEARKSLPAPLERAKPAEVEA